MILITGHILMRPETRAAAIALGIEHSARSRAEPGCIAHHVQLDAENDLRLTIVEQWADLAAVKAHFAVPASVDFARQLGALASASPVMQIFQAEDITALIRG